MSKSIKFKNDIYLDSSSVVYDNVGLNRWIGNYSCSGNTTYGTTYPYKKLISIKLPKAYQTFYLKFSLIERENVAFMFNGEILIHLDYNKVINNMHFFGSYTVKNVDNVKIILYLENNESGEVELSLYWYLPFNWRTPTISIINCEGLEYVTFIYDTKEENEPTYIRKIEI